MAKLRHPFVCSKCLCEDSNGVLRFKEKAIVRWMADRMSDAHDYHWMQRREESFPCVNLNSMAIAFQEGKFPLHEYQQFYRDMGYSLCGFEEVFGVDAFCEHRAQAANQQCK